MTIRIGLSRSNTWLSKAIRWFGKHKTGNAQYSHAFLLFGDTVYESLWNGVKATKYRKYRGKPHVLYTPIFVTGKQSKVIEKYLLRLTESVKGSYGYTKLPLFALDALFKTYKFTNRWSITSFKVCSQLACYCFYKKIKYYKFKNWRSMSPDDIDDFCMIESSDWSRKTIN